MLTSFLFVLNSHVFTKNVSLSLPSQPRTHCTCFVHYHHMIMSTGYVVTWETPLGLLRRPIGDLI